MNASEMLVKVKEIEMRLEKLEKDNKGKNIFSVVFDFLNVKK